MKKTILATLMLVFITSMSFATVTEKATSSDNYELRDIKTDPFCMAIVKGDLEAVKKMIELGRDVNQKWDGMTPLMYAARYNRVEIMKLLIDKGANAKARDDRGRTAMKFAKQSNATDAIALLEKLT